MGSLENLDSSSNILSTILMKLLTFKDQDNRARKGGKNLRVQTEVLFATAVHIILRTRFGRSQLFIGGFLRLVELL